MLNFFSVNYTMYTISYLYFFKSNPRFIEKNGIKQSIIYCNILWYLDSRTLYIHKGVMWRSYVKIKHTLLHTKKIKERSYKGIDSVGSGEGKGRGGEGRGGEK